MEESNILSGETTRNVSIAIDQICREIKFATLGLKTLMPKEIKFSSYSQGPTVNYGFSTP